jgi:hypothetical protein
MNRRLLSTLALLIGLLLVVVALVYWISPAGSLPHFFPGFTAGSAQRHVKHGLASFIVALGLFAYAWFQTGKK